jgi:hypothetical protein
VPLVQHKTTGDPFALAIPNAIKPADLSSTTEWHSYFNCMKVRMRAAFLLPGEITTVEERNEETKAERHSCNDINPNAKVNCLF